MFAGRRELLFWGKRSILSTAQTIRITIKVTVRVRGTVRPRFWIRAFNCGKIFFELSRGIVGSQGISYDQDMTCRLMVRFGLGENNCLCAPGNSWSVTIFARLWFLLVLGPGLEVSIIMYNVVTSA